MQDPVEYERLLPYQFQTRIKSHPLVYVPVGSLEWHGEHMALGNDALKMHALCCEAARLGGGIVYPPIFYGIPYMVDYGAQYPHKANLPVTAAFLGDLASWPIHIERLAWVPAYDLEPMVSIETKRSIARWAVQNQVLLFFEHHPQVIAGYLHSTERDDRFRLEAVEFEA